MRRFLNRLLGRKPSAPAIRTPMPLHELQSATRPHVSLITRERALLLEADVTRTLVRRGSACVLDRFTLLTAHHVVEDMAEGAMQARGLLTHPLPARKVPLRRVLMADPANDLAVVELAEPLPYRIPYLPVYDKVGLVGDALHAFSIQRELPLELKMTTTPYTLAAHQIGTPSAFIGGDSGSGLYGPTGALYGVVTHLVGRGFKDLRTGSVVMTSSSVNLATYAPAIRALLKKAHWPGLP